MEQPTGAKLGKECIKAVNCTLGYLTRGFPGGSDGKESACNAGDPGSIPGSGRSLEKGNGDYHKK